MWKCEMGPAGRLGVDAILSTDGQTGGQGETSISTLFNFVEPRGKISPSCCDFNGDLAKTSDVTAWRID